MTLSNYRAFISTCAEPNRKPETLFVHSKAFTQGAYADIITINEDNCQLVVTARPALTPMPNDAILYVCLTYIEESIRSHRDTLAMAGIRHEEALDLFTQQPARNWVDIPFGHQLRLATTMWIETGPPSVVIFARARTAEKDKCGDAVALQIPPSMRLLTPVIVVTDHVADEFNNLLTNYGIAPLRPGAVTVLMNEKQAPAEHYRAQDLKADSRKLGLAIISALGEIAAIAEDLNAIGDVVGRTDDELAILREQLQQTQEQRDALAAQLSRVQAELKRKTKLARRLEHTRRVDEPGLAKDTPTVLQPAQTDEERPQEVDDSDRKLPPLTAPNFTEMLTQAADLFTHLSINQGIRKRLSTLENSPKRSIWLERSWLALALLDEYAAEKHHGDETGTFRAWMNLHPHAIIRPAHVRSGETTLMRAGKYGEARTFSAPTADAPHRRVQFLTHIYIESGNVDPNPRLHFYDDTPGSGLIYIGHLGPHLTTRRTN